MNVYDCLNIKGKLSGTQKIIISGVVNPDYEMTISDIEVHILQPNNKVVLEIIRQSPTTPIQISHKVMNTTITIPNKYRNNTLTYIFEINMDSDLGVGDYLKIELNGNWTYFIEDSRFIEGIGSNALYTPVFEETYDHPTSSVLKIRNFSEITRTRQIAFYVSLRTPLTAANYNLVLSAFRSHGGLVEKHTQTV